MSFIVALACTLIVYFIVCCVYQNIISIEAFECSYLNKQPITQKGCFQYSTKLGDTCKSIQSQFQTDQHNVVSMSTKNYCADDTMTNAETGKKAPPIHQGERFTICPKYNCIYTKPPFHTTCGEQAVAYNTELHNIHYTPDGSTHPTKKCMTNQESIQSQSRMNVCKSDALDTMRTLDTIYPSNVSECQQSCDTNKNCKYVLYGNATCHLMTQNTPMMNIVSVGQDTDMYKCSPSLPLKYNGLTSKQMSVLPCRLGGEKSTCKYLGGVGCNDSDGTCLSPYRSTTEKTRHPCVNAWKTLVAQQPSLPTTQTERDSSIRLLCSPTTRL